MEPTQPITPCERNHLSLPLLVLLGIVIALISSFATYVYLKNSDKPIPEISAESNQNSPSLVSTNDISIPELGITITVPNSLNDLTHSVETVKYPTFSARVVGFSTQSLTNLDKDCAASGADGALGALTKVSGQYPVDANIDNAAGTLVKQFSNFYIGYRNVQATCSNKSEVNSTASSANAQFRASFPTIK